MNAAPIGAFQKAIRATHGAGSRLVERVRVVEDFEGERASYAWEVDGEVTAVLGVPPVDGPRAAVRAAIVADVE